MCCAITATPGTTPQTARRTVSQSSSRRRIFRKTSYPWSRVPASLLCHILPPPLRPQRAGRALAAAIAPVMPIAAFADIAGVGALADQVDEPCPAEIICELPGRRLVTPHQRRVQL